jgi:hypothetical protein
MDPDLDLDLGGPKTSGSPTLPDPLCVYTQAMQGNLEQNYLHVSLEVMACGEGVHNLELLQLGAVILHIEPP